MEDRHAGDRNDDLSDCSRHPGLVYSILVDCVDGTLERQRQREHPKSPTARGMSTRRIGGSFRVDLHFWVSALTYEVKVLPYVLVGIP